jgi:hypothetical protein
LKNDKNLFGRNHLQPQGWFCLKCCCCFNHVPTFITLLCISTPTNPNLELTITQIRQFLNQAGCWEKVTYNGKLTHSLSDCCPVSKHEQAQAGVLSSVQRHCWISFHWKENLLASECNIFPAAKDLKSVQVKIERFPKLGLSMLASSSPEAPFYLKSCQMYSLLPGENGKRTIQTVTISIT